ncbi:MULTISPECIES: cell division protein FtsZ [Desulfococcus]|jgi:cell division protein FtsZ|uniref:Cell division protein FtsZ n=1 Tax=Desulfococcus multivorans DSM 2059 TaxID=1121405 RepID=S7TCC0_DESML|nr:cell division protein FtsZ [Desulfococcus multivorans]AOY59544.1 FtsZ: cell division protein FtsZ [Desulfococcus multivorans]AQV01739.1 cell division protein FtsZ [Desulfococcus multivorans]EPR34190.1 cell division protein FtsZ [Desulfococcus multivorans DSM 2059]SKA19928.1 cell division protein FtsZ [Desulfococcus multivorans DSM 2059]
MFNYVENDEKTAKIKVIGVGGAGGNAVNNMIDSDLRGVNFIVANTDLQALDLSKAPLKIQIGDKLTEGLGAGANPQIGREAALENAEAIRNALKDSHMVFITAGFGGGTGTGAAPVIAEICKELGALTVAVVSKPFSFEGRKRLHQAEEGLDFIREVADTVITIPNDRLRGLASKNATMIEMFRRADEVLLHSVKGITDLILMPGLVNLDFADVKTTMEKAGMAIMGIGVASGENRAIEAAERAISHPLLEDLSISGAKGVLMNITSTSDLTMEEMTEASERIYSEVGEDAEIIWGTVVDESLGDEMRVTVIATGIGEEPSSMSNRRRNPKNYQSARSVSRSAKKEEFKRQPYRSAPKERGYADYPHAVDYEEPAFLRQKKTDKDSVRDTGYEAFDDKEMDIDDLDIPTFLRRKAD